MPSRYTKIVFIMNSNPEEISEAAAHHAVHKLAKKECRLSAARGTQAAWLEPGPYLCSLVH